MTLSWIWLLYLLVMDNQVSLPVFSAVDILKNISENLQPGAEILTVSAYYNQSDLRDTLIYTLFNDIYEGTFSINSSNGKILLETALDSEKSAVYFLNISVRIQGSLSDTEYVNVTIIILNEDKEVPILKEAGNVYVSYSTVLNNSVMWVTPPIQPCILDVPTGQLIYEIWDNYSSLSIDRSSGVIKTVKPLNTYTNVFGIVTASQSNNVSKFCVASLYLIVDIGTLFDISSRKNFTLFLPEDTPLNYRVVLGSGHPKIQWKFKERSYDVLKLFADGSIILVQMLDYETKKEYQYEVEVSYANKSMIIPLFVLVGNVNEVPPVINVETNTVKLQQPKPHTIVTNIQVSDHDENDVIIRFAKENECFRLVSQNNGYSIFTTDKIFATRQQIHYLDLIATEIDDLPLMSAVRVTVVLPRKMEILVVVLTIVFAVLVIVIFFIVAYACYEAKLVQEVALLPQSQAESLAYLSSEPNSRKTSGRKKVNNPS